MRDKDRLGNLILGISGAILVLWLGLLAAPYAWGGLPGILSHLQEITEDPFRIVLCRDTPRTVLGLEAVYGICLGAFAPGSRKYRKGEEHGSAQWGSPAALGRRYGQHPAENNKILTKHVRVGYDGRKHLRNLNTLVVGGSGAGKTRYVVKPNVLQASREAGASMVILDPKIVCC